jgi:hypothetical protein
MWCISVFFKGIFEIVNLVPRCAGSVTLSRPIKFPAIIKALKMHGGCDKEGKHGMLAINGGCIILWPNGLLIWGS